MRTRPSDPDHVPHIALVTLLAFVAASGTATAAVAQGASTCQPVDSAWAAELRITDRATGRPVPDASVRAGMEFAVTDSAGLACIRTLDGGAHEIWIGRRGYREETLTLTGRAGQVVSRHVGLPRVPDPCCDLRGEWSIDMRLETPARMHPDPSGRRVAGAVLLGPRHAAPQPGDDIDPIVRIVRGLHRVDFAPFFGGPVANDVSTTVFGSGPDLLREVEASVTAGDSVEVTFIPRMSHGSISMHGRIRNDTIRGEWIQNAYCCGASGTFTMQRTGPVDSGATAPAAPPPPWVTRLRAAAASVPAGRMPEGSWRPAFAIDEAGKLWLARGGLFVSESFGGAWRRTLGGPADPVEKDELRIGIHLAFADRDVVLVGLPDRSMEARAPVLYRSADDGASWRPVVRPGVRGVAAMRAIGSSVWVIAEGDDDGRTMLHVSDDGGLAWRDLPLPPAMRSVNDLYRISVREAFITASGRDKAVALWRTRDGGAHWTPVATPHDQGLHDVPDYGTRVEQLVSVGRWLVVREHGKVFVSPADTVRWRLMPRADWIAGDRSGTALFVVHDSLEAALLDRDLNPVWTTVERLAVPQGDYLDAVDAHAGAGYVVTGHGLLFEIREGRIRSIGARGRAESVEVRIRPPD